MDSLCLLAAAVSLACAVVVIGACMLSSQLSREEEACVPVLLVKPHCRHRRHAIVRPLRPVHRH